jgi:hypothetical protein
VKALGLSLAIVLAAGLPCAVAAQDVAARLDARVPADLAHAVQEIARDAAGRGLPVEPLIQKAIEGGAKGVPAPRVIAAVRQLAARLDEAQSAVRSAGTTAPSADAIESGAYALNTGMTASQVSELVRASRPPYDPAVTLRVVATLTALGVPAPQGLAMVEHMISERRAPSELLDLPSEVQAATARGATPTEAVQQLDPQQQGGGATHGPGQHGHSPQPPSPHPHKP